MENKAVIRLYQALHHMENAREGLKNAHRDRSPEWKELHTAFAKVVDAMAIEGHEAALHRFMFYGKGKV